jgi:hypothetical protein
MYNRSKQITDYFSELRQRNLKDIDDTIKRINVLNLEIKHIENNGDSFQTNVMGDYDYAATSSHGRRSSQITKSILELSASIVPFSSNNTNSNKYNKRNIIATPTKCPKEIISNEINTPIISNNFDNNDINTKEDNNENNNNENNSISNDDDNGGDKLTLDDLTITSTTTDGVLLEDNIEHSVIDDNSNNDINIKEENKENIKENIISTDYRRIYSEQYKRHYYIDQKTSETQWVKPSSGIISCIDDCDVVFYMNAKSKKTSWVVSEII